MGGDRASVTSGGTYLMQSEPTLRLLATITFERLCLATPTARSLCRSTACDEPVRLPRSRGGLPSAQRQRGRPLHRLPLMGCAEQSR
jgi:hypothetical protein